MLTSNLRIINSQLESRSLIWNDKNLFPSILDNFTKHTNFLEDSCDFSIATLQSLSPPELSITKYLFSSYHGIFLGIHEITPHPKNTSLVLNTQTAREKIVDIRWTKRHHQCQNKVVIIILPFSLSTEFNSETGTYSLDHSISKWLPTNSRLSEDHFVFLSPTLQQAEQILLSKQIGLKLKNKLAIILNSPIKSEFHPFITSCLYCDRGGSQIVPVLNSIQDTVDTVNLNGAHLHISSPRIPPRMTIIKKSDGSSKLVRGLYKYLLEDAIMPRYNMTYSIALSEKGAVGDFNPTKGFFGVMQDVITDKVDLGICVGFIPTRYPYVEYGTLLEAEYLTFSSGKRAPYISWKAVLWTFTPTMWSCTLISFLLAVTILFGMSTWNTRENSITGFFSAVNYIFAAFFDQSATRTPVSTACRIFCASWLLYSLVMSNAFREKLFGFLSFPQEIHIPQSFQELASSKFEVGLQFYGGAAYNYIKTSTTATFMKISERMSLETDPIQCFTKSMEKDFSCIHYHGAAEFVRARNLSDRHGQANIVVAPAATLLLSISIIMSKDSVLMEQVNQVIRPVRDMGLVGQWKKMDFNKLLRKRVQWEMETGIFKESEIEDHVRALGMDPLLGPFGMLLVGEGMAVVAFVLIEMRAKMVRRVQGVFTRRRWILLRIALLVKTL